MSSRSDFLFVQPSFLRGMARAIDLFGVLEADAYNVSRSPGEADYRALLSDWSVVGGDIRDAADFYREQERARLAQ